MAEGVKWIRINTDMFDNAKIKYLRRLPDGDKIILIWVMLLTKAGKCNSNGYIFLTENIPYTPEMLAAEFDFEVSTVNLALGSLSRLNMIQQKEETLLVTGWEEHQNAEGLEKIREQTRKRVAKCREKQKLIPSNVTGNVTVTESNATDIERDIDIDIDIERDNSISKDILVPKHLVPIQEKWNSLGLSKIRDIKGNRLKLLNARIKEYGLDGVLEAIENIKSSCFLRGQNKDNWIIVFDWLIKPNNFKKVLEGNYKDKEVNYGHNTSSTGENKKWDYTIPECELTEEERRRAAEELL
ncbi:phage replisome organizer N-terminal domain-containing protein [Clostridium culturomicium]|uniref:phage replisome organizer N-terminal domain-containing protein n=1 Tax=Clostridium culturomicium TaxID=1499683 RepID=UPI0006931E21|nr:phage replisome organizer N-terminal domain-containing protein [Clostridium culturomicium]